MYWKKEPTRLLEKYQGSTLRSLHSLLLASHQGHDPCCIHLPTKAAAVSSLTFRPAGTSATTMAHHPPPPPPADAAVDAPPVPVAVVPQNYRNAFVDSTRDPVDGRPVEYLLRGYRFVEGGDWAIPAAPAALRDQTWQLCNRRAMAFLCLVSRPGDHPEVRILH